MKVINNIELQRRRESASRGTLMTIGRFTQMLLVALLVATASAETRYEDLAYINGILNLHILDGESGKPTPARVKVLGPDGKFHVAKDALLVPGDCGATDEAMTYSPMMYDGTYENAISKLSARAKGPMGIHNHKFFYSSGKSKLVLRPGLYRIMVTKGPEFNAFQTAVPVEAGKVSEEQITLSRFANMPGKGWYSADDHLHIARPHKKIDPMIIQLMQAEDVHVGNLLQIGWPDKNLTMQQQHNIKREYQEGNYIIASGQENLRTHLFGHTITLGASEPIHMGDKYLLYRLAWEKAAKKGALNGYAHRGDTIDGGAGVTLLAPHNLMHFMEVVHLRGARFDLWYDLLNLGFRITPTGGTDFPCGLGDPPGGERFYTKVEGEFTYGNWLEAVRAGWTFATTGPLLEFSVNGKEIGSDITLPAPREVTIKGEVRYQTRDIPADPYIKGSMTADGGGDAANPFTGVRELQLIENGRIVHRVPRVDNGGKISFEIRHKVEETAWLALRAVGYPEPSNSTSTVAHSAPVYVTLANAPTLMEHPRARYVAQKWLLRLDALEERLSSEENLEYLGGFKTVMGATPYRMLLDSHSELMEEIDYAKSYFKNLMKKTED